MRRLLIGVFTISLSLWMVGLVLPLYASDLGASYTEIGILGVAYVVMGIVFSAPVGLLSDRRGRAQFIKVGLLTTALVFMLYPMAGAVFLLIALRFVQGATEQLIWVNAQGAVADQSMSAKRGRAMGTYGTSWGLGVGIGPIVGGVLYASFGATATFLLSAVLAFVATAIVATVSTPRPKFTMKRPDLTPILPACFAGLVYLGIVSIVFNILPVYVKTGLGLSAVQAGSLVTIFAGIRAIVFTPLGLLSDRIGHRPVILAGLVGSSLASAGIALVSGFQMLAVMVAVLAVAEGAIYPAIMSTVSNAAKGRNFGYLLGVHHAVTLVGWAMFLGVGGVLADACGPTSPFLLCTIMGLGATALLWKWLGKK